MHGVVREVYASMLLGVRKLVSATGEWYKINQCCLLADSEEKLCKLVNELCMGYDRKKVRVNLRKSKVIGCSSYVNVVRVNGRVDVESFTKV